MAALTVPPDYPFAFVLEYPAPLAPHISRLLAGLYGEPARQTRYVDLSGKSRHLVFVVLRSSRDRAYKLGWRDVTDRWKHEWELQEGKGWVKVRVTEPPPIKAPDRKPPAVERDADPLELPVKELGPILASGKLDGQLTELLTRERAGNNGTGKSRGGAVALIASRIGVVGSKPEAGGPPPTLPPAAPENEPAAGSEGGGGVSSEA